MKNSDEMIQSLLRRREKYFESQRKKRRTTAVAGTSVLSVCIVALVGFGVLNLGMKRSDPADPVGDESYNTEESRPADVKTKSTVGTDIEDESDRKVSDDASGQHNGEEHDIAGFDLRGALVIGGDLYEQILGRDTEGWTKKDFLGKASEFDGTYKNLYGFGIEGDVYSVNESPDAVLIYLTNGGVVALEKTEDDRRISLPEGGTTVTGEPITYAEAEAFFDENLDAISNMFSLHGEFGNISVRGGGYCPIVRDAHDEERKINLSERVYFLYDGECLIGEYKLIRDTDGTLYGSLKSLFSNEEQSALFEEYQNHKGEKLIFIEDYWQRFIITPENNVIIFGPGLYELEISPWETRAENVFSVEEGFNVYGYFYNENAVYIP